MASYVVECASNSNDIDTLITTELATPLLTVPEATGGQTGQARSLKLPRSDSVCVLRVGSAERQSYLVASSSITLNA